MAPTSDHATPNNAQLEADEFFMRQALVQAQLAAQVGEVPVGAVVVRQGEVIAAAHNAPISNQDPSAHAEINAMRQAARLLGNYRLEDCTLYVTLEPCTMCSGALLNARFKRVVFGANEPRTGAAGSVHNVFGIASLNPQTQISGGVLAQDCAAVMQDFFKTRRDNPNPLREDALRTPDACFASLHDFDWPAHYVSDLPSLQGWRMHYIDAPAQQPAANEVAASELSGLPAASNTNPSTSRPQSFTFLCLHSHDSWGYLYRDMLPVLVGAGHRVLVPDLIGFGKSDKPKKPAVHTLEFHRDYVLAWLTHLNVQDCVLVLPQANDALGLSLLESLSFIGIITTQTNTSSLNRNDQAALQAPYPDKGHRAAPQAMSEWRNLTQPKPWPIRHLDLNLSPLTHGSTIAQEAVKFFT